MATGIAQKRFKALFPLWFLKKKGILKLINQKSRRGKTENIGKNFKKGLPILHEF